MCLIIYSKNGALPNREDYYSGAKDNPDGIGIMSVSGVRKFMGRKSIKKSWAYVRRLADRGEPFGVHFRWATHGEIGRRNTHPFHVPKLDLFLMHNGILWTSTYATDKDSDTAVFARDILPTMGHPDAPREDAKSWISEVQEIAGPGNKLLILDPESGAFHLANEAAGYWMSEGLWYSNTHSIVSRKFPKHVSYSPGFVSRAYKSTDELAEYPLSGDWLARRDEQVQRLIRQEELEQAFAGEIADGRILPDDIRQWTDDVSYWQECRIAAARDLGRKVPTIPWKKDTGGFDWHDRSTWDKYPLPGTVARIRPLVAKDADDSDSDGVQQYV